MSLFLGFLPDAAATQALAALQRAAQAGLAGDAPPHAWRTPRQWHVTLAYLGQSLADPVRRSLVEAMAPVAADAAPTALAFDALQYWPGANVLVAGLSRDARLLALHAAINTVIRAHGLAPDTRAPRPHVTLAYLPRHGVAVPQAAPAAAPADTHFGLHTLQLLQTRPGHYACLHAWPLGGAAP